MRARPVGALALVALVVACVPEAPARQVAPPDVVELTAERIGRDQAEGRPTTRALVDAYLARIATYEPVYNAFVSLNPTAPAEAAALDEERRARGPRGPLHGVPVVVKDNMDVAGMVTTAGYEGFSAETGGMDLVPERDAVVVARLRAAGAVLLGKTNLPDFAADGTRTRSTVAGVTRNPWSLDRAPGGSSGGTATAVNASFAPVGLGTETGGSIQNPAAAQGLVGVTPTPGLVPLGGVVPLDPRRDVVGPLARTVRDAALVLEVIADSAGRYLAALDTATLRGRRFGLVGSGWREDHLPLAPVTDSLYRAAVAALRARGADVVEDPFRGTRWLERYRARPSTGGAGNGPLDDYLAALGSGAAFHSVAEWEARTGRVFRDRARGEGREGGDAAVIGPASGGGDAFTAWREEMRALFREVLAAHDLDGLFFPQAGAPIRPLVTDPERPDFSPNDHPELPSNVVNDVGLPVVTLPVASYPDGMPFVVAFVGEPWSEAELLAFAHALERATRARRPPTLVTDTLR